MCLSVSTVLLNIKLLLWLSKPVSARCYYHLRDLLLHKFVLSSSSWTLTGWFNSAVLSQTPIQADSGWLLLDFQWISELGLKLTLLFFILWLICLCWPALNCINSSELNCIQLNCTKVSRTELKWILLLCLNSTELQLPTCHCFGLTVCTKGISVFQPEELKGYGIPAGLHEPRMTLHVIPCQSKHGSGLKFLYMNQTTLLINPGV